MDPCITILENRPRANRGIAGQSETCPSNTRRVIVGIDAIDHAYYTVADGDGQTKAAREAGVTRLNQILDEHDFDQYVEERCQRFYSDEGRPGLPPGRYFRQLLIGYFEGLDAERAIAWRAADSLALREFLGLVLPEASPDHSTISRTRRLIDLETHEAVFTWMLQRVADAGLVNGKTCHTFFTAKSYGFHPSRAWRV